MSAAFEACPNAMMKAAAIGAAEKRCMTHPQNFGCRIEKIQPTQYPATIHSEWLTRALHSRPQNRVLEFLLQRYIDNPHTGRGLEGEAPQDRNRTGRPHVFATERRLPILRRAIRQIFGHSPDKSLRDKRRPCARRDRQ